MSPFITILYLLLAALAEAADQGTLLDVYSNKEAYAQSSKAVSVQSISAQPSACSDASACLAQCSTDPLLGQDPVAVQKQLIQCTNNMRLATSLFEADISAVCSFDDVQSAAVGLDALEGSPALNNVAQSHSDEMAAQNYFSHFSSNGSSPYDRVRSVVPDADYVSELTAAGWPSVRAVLVQLVCSAKHRSVLMSCAYDTIGWGSHFSAVVAPQQQWQTYFTADLVCTTPNGCSCTRQSEQPVAAALSPTATRVPATAAAPPPPEHAVAPAAAHTAPATLPPVPPSVSTQASRAVAPARGHGQSMPAPASSPTSPASTLLITCTLAVTAVASGSGTNVQSTLVAAIVAAAAPAHVTVTVSKAAPRASGRRKLLQATWSMQATVNFTVGNVTASLSDSDLTAILSHDVSEYLQPLAVVTMEASFDPSSGEHAFSVLLPPDDQSGGQQAGFGSLQASRLTDALQHAPSAALVSLAAVSAFTVASIDMQVKVVKAQAEPASAGVIPPLPATQGLLTAPAAQPTAAPTVPVVSPAVPSAPVAVPAAPHPILFYVDIHFPASQSAAAEALLAALSSSPSIFPAMLQVSVLHVALVSAAQQAGSTTAGAGIESAGSEGGTNGVSGALYATSMELSFGTPQLPLCSSGEATLIAALQGNPVPVLQAADVAVALSNTSNTGTASVYAFGASQPGTFLLMVTSPANYTGQVSVSLSNLVAVAPLTYLVAGPSAAAHARATAWRLSQLLS